MVRTDRITVNVGPHHPAAHGVLRMIATLEGETVMDMDVDFGYLHRCHEKLAESQTYLQNMPFTDRLDYLCSMANNQAYAMAVEKLAGIEVPERAEYIRVITVELTRLMNHAFAIGLLLNDMGAMGTPVFYAMRQRERILDLLEMVSGGRMMCNYFRFGGVRKDLPDEFLPAARALVAAAPRLMDEFEALLTGNEILQSRCIGVGVLPADTALAYSVTGPMLRASGVPYDVRKVDGYSVYDRFDFEVPVFHGGDVYDRYRVRIGEMRQSVRILEQALEQLPDKGEVVPKLPWPFRIPPGEAYARIESPKGELGFYLASNGTIAPWRYHVRSPCFINLTVFPELCQGHTLPDAVIILGSIDIIMGEVDR